MVGHGAAVLEAGCRPRGVEFRLRSGGIALYGGGWYGCSGWATS